MRFVTLKVCGEVDDLDGLKGAFLDADTATNAQNLGEKRDLVRVLNLYYTHSYYTRKGFGVVHTGCWKMGCYLWCDYECVCARVSMAQACNDWHWLHRGSCKETEPSCVS